MANNYLEFSEIVPNLTAPEEAWLEAQLQTVRAFGNNEYLEDAVPAELADTAPDWSGPRLLRDFGDYDPDYDSLGFQYAFHKDEARDGWGRYLCLYAEEYGNPEHVAHLVQKFLKTFRPDQCWLLTYATTCSKPRAGEFGGGASFVMADEIKWQNVGDFVEQERTAFEARKPPSHQTEEQP